MNLIELISAREAAQQRVDAIMEHVTEESATVRQIDEQINAIILEPIKQARLMGGKDTGTVDVLVAGVMVKHQVAKVVKWDQAKLEDIRRKIREHNDDPDAYMKTKINYTIDEKAYKDFPAPVKAVFSEAREVKAGPPKITFDTNWR